LAMRFVGYYNGYNEAANIIGIVDGGPGPYLPGRLEFQTAGNNELATTRMVITSSGSVGIGTTNPGASLHVVSTSTISTAFKVQTGSILGTEVVISTTGNVGIGTSSPTAKLDIQSTNPNDQYILSVSTQSDYILRVSTMGEVNVNGNISLGNGAVDGNKPITIWLRNNSGAPRSYGEIVAIDTTMDNAFTCAVDASSKTVVGVVYSQSIPPGSTGQIAIGGVVQVMIQGPVERGESVIPSNVLCEATSMLLSAPTTPGTAIGKYLEGCSTAGGLCRAVLFSH